MIPGCMRTSRPRQEVWASDTPPSTHRPPSSPPTAAQNSLAKTSGPMHPKHRRDARRRLQEHNRDDAKGNLQASPIRQALASFADAAILVDREKRKAAQVDDLDVLLPDDSFGSPGQFLEKVPSYFRRRHIADRLLGQPSQPRNQQTHAPVLRWTKPCRTNCKHRSSALTRVHWSDDASPDTHFTLLVGYARAGSEAVPDAPTAAEVRETEPIDFVAVPLDAVLKCHGHVQHAAARSQLRLTGSGGETKKRGRCESKLFGTWKPLGKTISEVFTQREAEWDMDLELRKQTKSGQRLRNESQAMRSHSRKRRPNHEHRDSPKKQLKVADTTPTRRSFARSAWLLLNTVRVVPSYGSSDFVMCFTLCVFDCVQR